MSKNQRGELEKRLKSIEAEIPRFEAEATRLSNEMSRPEIASDFPKLSELTGSLNTAEKRVNELYAEWETITSKLNES